MINVTETLRKIRRTNKRKSEQETNDKQAD